MRLDHVLSYEEFLVQHLEQNRPALIPRGLVEGWPAFTRWKSAFWDVLAADYAGHMVPVVIGEERCEMELKDAVAAIHEQKGPIYIKDWHLVRDARRQNDHASERQLPYWTPPLFADDCAHTS